MSQEKMWKCVNNKINAPPERIIGNYCILWFNRQSKSHKISRDSSEFKILSSGEYIWKSRISKKRIKFKKRDGKTYIVVLKCGK